MKIRKQIGLWCLLCCLTANAQKAVVKTNLLYDLAATANVGVEWGVTPHWTIDLSANYNGWTFGDNKKWKHWLLQPEARYWLCERFNGHFVGAHLLGGTYNLGNLDTDFKLFGTDFGQLKDYRFEGWMMGAGLTYGYHWILSRRWSIEAAIGIGYVYTRADKYECPHCGDKLEEDRKHHYFGPTKAAVNLIYAF